MDNIQLKRVTLAELDVLQNISKQTFLETFAKDNSEENMQRYLNDSFNSDKLTQELNCTGSEFYLAVSEKKTVGYLKLNSGNAQTERMNVHALEIERIYVLKLFHGNRIGQILYEKALERAYQLNAPFLWLGVWEKNQRAIHFYKKNGLIEFDKHIFKLGDDEQTDLLMKLDLS